MKNMQLYIPGIAMQSMLISDFARIGSGDLNVTLGDGRRRRFEMQGRPWVARISEQISTQLGEVVSANTSHVSISNDTDEIFSSDAVANIHQSAESQLEVEVVRPTKSRELIVWHKQAPLVVTTSPKPDADQTGIVEPGKSNPAPSISADASADVRESRVAFTKRTGQAVSFAAVVAEARVDYAKVAPQLIGLKEADFVGQRLFSLGIEATAEQIAAALK